MYRFTTEVDVSRRGAGDWPGFLDMLRYDRARVISWDQGRAHWLMRVPDDRMDDRTLRIELETERMPTMARWQSFLLPVIGLKEV